MEVKSLPPGDWIGAYQKLGFSEASATSYAGMTKATIDGEFPRLAQTERGATSLQSYIEDLVRRSSA